MAAKTARRAHTGDCYERRAPHDATRPEKIHNSGKPKALRDQTLKAIPFAETHRRKQHSRTHATSRAVVGEHPGRGKMICVGDVAERLRTYKCKSCIPHARGQVVGASGTRNCERQRDAGPKRSRQRLRAGPDSASARERSGMQGFAKKPRIGGAGPRRVGAGIGRWADIAWRNHAWAQA